MSSAQDVYRFSPIGVLRTPFSEPAGTPIQPRFAGEARGSALIDEPYREGLRDLEGFDRLWLLYVFHRSGQWHPSVVPFRDTRSRGLFATRAPARPAPIGLSVVRLVSVSLDRLELADVDMLDGTPLLDIKPYVPRFDSFDDARAGWLDEADASGCARTVADQRFNDDSNRSR